ncbi:unnamed protein product [Rotaria sp. Silwood1]|nr:unnamed protein product [Rotaria sp. Silwood1]
MILHDGATAALSRFSCAVLDTNSFAYKDKYYRQIKAYTDDVFMTTNLSKEDILKELDGTIKTDSNVKISTTSNQSLEYLDVTIENNNGHLKISIYHKSASKPYILPYESDHPRHVHANIIYTALVRAARNCSNVEDFDMERLSTEMILLVNGYSPKFIQHHIKNILC